MNKKVVFGVALILIVLITVTSVSAFSFSGWVKNIFGGGKVTGYPIYDGSSSGLKLEYSFQEASYTGLLS